MAQNGTITAHVFTARARIPIVGATVALSQRLTGKKHTLLAVRITDENGEIEPIPIPAPQGSQQPGGPLPASALLDMRVEHPEYQQEIVEDIQVFSAVASVQEVQLIPLSEHAIPRNSYDVIRITPQDL